MNTVTKIIEEVAEQICDNYCKYSEKLKFKTTDEEFDEFQHKYCDNCPLNKL